MADSLHILCPHCDGVNRVPTHKLADDPKCGRCRSTLFTGRALEVDSDRLTRQLQRSGVPLLVDFWAPWCGPCQMMAPALEQAAKQLEPEFRVLKLNTEGAPELSRQLGIRSIPTLILFEHGSEQARTAGAMDSGNLVAWARQNRR